MDGVHDLGGADGMGPVEHTTEGEEPAFHADWERRTLGLLVGAMAQGQFTMGAFRHAIERMAPAWYLDSPYYEHWLAALEKLLVKNGTVDAEELRERVERASTGDLEEPDEENPQLAAAMRSMPDAATSTEREGPDPAFAVGDAVRVRNIHPEGHTRCPEYVRQAEGTVRQHHGAHVYPDTNAHGRGESPRPLYSVRFDGEEPWGTEAESGTAVCIDLREPYLEAAEQ